MDKASTTHFLINLVLVCALSYTLYKACTYLIWKRRKKILGDMAIQSMTEPLKPIKILPKHEKWMDAIERKKR